MSKYTPGPWEMRGPCANGRYSVIHNGPLFYVGDAGEPGDGEANARLAASAPELLEALRDAESFMSGFEGDELQEPYISKSLATIRAVITKATRGQP